MEFGVRWGQNLALFESFRGIYEPYNYNRKIVGFDELNYNKFPGETIALSEVLGLDKYSIKRSPISPLQSYVVVE